MNKCISIELVVFVNLTDYRYAFVMQMCMPCSCAGAQAQAESTVRSLFVHDDTVDGSGSFLVCSRVPQ